MRSHNWRHLMLVSVGGANEIIISFQTSSSASMALDFWQGLFPFVRPSFSTQQTDSNDDHTANNPNDTDNV